MSYFYKMQKFIKHETIHKNSILWSFIFSRFLCNSLMDNKLCILIFFILICIHMICMDLFFVV
ncbi:hypothetical protein EGY59_24085 [Salmonella enterica]|nr:hypothetical protein [Salmonella enterica]EBK0598422.1 hypothetical protein [Salmonella enterica]EBW6352486.1 hypothetical protein [Salmonella enterica subsp. enterica serovar Javiana]